MGERKRRVRDRMESAMRKIAVGSKNPVKREAVLQAFYLVWPDEEWIVEPVEVSSGVSAQPMSDEESIDGARQRARAALAACPAAHYGVGLEGGLHKIGGYYFDSGWAVVVARDGGEGVGSTAKIMTPPAIARLIEQGMELGEANDSVFGAINSKQSQGHFGLMTKGVITRAAAYRDGVIVALSRFLHPHLFEGP